MARCYKEGKLCLRTIHFIMMIDPAPGMCKSMISPGTLILSGEQSQKIPSGVPGQRSTGLETKNNKTGLIIRSRKEARGEASALSE